MTRALALLSGVLLSGCAAAGTFGESSPLSGGSARTEQVVVGVHTDISGVAASRSMVFAATQDALLLYDVVRDAWLPPLSREDGYPGGPATIVAADPMEDGVWVAAFGSVLYYRPQVDLLTSTLLPGVADAMFFDQRNPASGAYVRSGGAWALVSRTGTALPVSAQQLPPAGARLTPSSLRDVYREFPTLQSFAVLLTRDARMRSWPVSAGARAPDRSEVFLGTRGNGVYRVDPIFQDAHHLPFGLLESAAASIAPAIDGVWIGGAGTSPTGRSGVTFASHDLQRWIWFEGPAGRPLDRTRVESIAPHGTALWLATDRGVIRLDTTDPESRRQWTLAEGLGADHALAIVPGFNGSWVGTTRGLAWIDEEEGGTVRSVSNAGAVRALLMAGEMLWIGSESGLLVLAGTNGEGNIRRPPALEQEVRLRRPVRALAHFDTVLLAASDDAIHAVDARTGRALAALPGIDALAMRGITSVAMDDRTIWVGGTAGVAVISRATGSTRMLRAGRDLPGDVTGIALAPGVAWIATRRGVVRLTRYPDGGIR